MTQRGGPSNNGVVFQIHADGSSYTNLHTFAGGTGDGANPEILGVGQPQHLGATLRK